MVKFSLTIIKSLCLPVSALFLLGACAETQLLVHTAKRLSKKSPAPSPSRSRGEYKVGTPYQIKGIWYHPRVDYKYNHRGIASWYGPGFHGKKTANGEIYDQNALTAAHKTLPMPSLVQVTNLENGRSLRLKVNDRGPFVHGRIIDLSRRGAQLLGFYRQGTARVQVQVLEAESRFMAREAMGDSILAFAGSPIRSNTKLPKAKVAKSSLPPPEGAGESFAVDMAHDNNTITNQSRNHGVARVSEVQPDGEVTTVAVKPGKMYIQVGAFTQYDNAYRVAARLGTLNNVKVTSRIVNGQEFFRVRAGPIDSLNDADFLLESILLAGFDAARLIVD